MKRIVSVLYWRELIMIFAAAAFLIAAAAISYAGSDSATCRRFHIPTRSCQRAVRLGYYCPSWDITTGLRPYICYGITSSPREY